MGGIQSAAEAVEICQEGQRMTREARMKKEEQEDNEITPMLIKSMNQCFANGEECYSCPTYGCLRVVRKRRLFLENMGYKVDIYDSADDRWWHAKVCCTGGAKKEN